MDSTVMKEAFGQLNQAAIEFICKEFALSAIALRTMTEDDLEDIYDQLCDIESAETPSDNSPLTTRGKMVESIVTIVGNYFAKELGYDDEWDEFINEIDEE